jgi:serine/threonine protein kinase
MLTNKKLTLFIKMELCDKTLEQIIDEIQSDSSFRKDDILTPIGYYIASLLFIEILKGVQYLHENNIIHRDLKPLNILLKKDKNYKSFIKIADFGLLVLHKFSEQSHTIDKGTPKYMAPEVISNKKYDFKADIYSLGIIFEQLIDSDVTRLAIHIYFFKLY